MEQASSQWSRPWALLFGLGAGLLVPGSAAADKVSDAMAECRGRAEGDACAVAGRKGACVARSFERPSGMSKRWIECSPGAKPRRVKSERKIDAAGPVGVLPSVGAVEDEGEPPTEPAVAGAEVEAEAEAGAPIEADAGPTTPSEPEKAPAADTAQGQGASAQPAPKDDDDAADGVSSEKQRSGCRTVIGGSELEPALFGLLFFAWRRRTRDR